MDSYILLMDLSEGFYGAYGGVYNIHALGYADLCEEFSEKCNEPWFEQTHGVLFCDQQIALLDIADNGDFVCKISDGNIGIIPSSQMHSANRFADSLLDCYAFHLGFVGGSAEYEGEIDLVELKNILVKIPLMLDKPFDFCVYFERKLTIELSKEKLNKFL